MAKTSDRIIRRVRRKRGIRKGIFGTPARPRLSVFRSNQHIYAQVINDLTGKTIAAASTRDKDFTKDSASGNIAAATAVGEKLAANATKAGVTDVQFDRNGFRYHGRVKALADSARKGGLKF